MTDFSDKLEEIERNIQEGQAMLSALRKLPESEEINAQIQRFEELVQRLEEYREQYKVRQSTSLSDLDSQLEALRDRHERIKEMLEQTSVKGLLDMSQASEMGQSCSTQPEQVLETNKPPTSSDRDCIEQLESNSYTLDPSEWRLHYEAQTNQLSEMLSEIARCQVMLGRLSDNLLKYDLTSTVNLLSAVGQSFTGVHLKLHFLKKSYEEFLNQENKTDGYIVSQLKHLRSSLIAAKISLTVNKDNFLSIADTIKKALDSRNEGISADDAARMNGDNRASTTPTNPSEPDSRPSGDVEAVEEGQQQRENGEKAVMNEDEDGDDEEAKMQQEIVDLRKKRDLLIAKLAEARAAVHTNSSSSSAGTTNVANASNVAIASEHHGDTSGNNNDTAQEVDSLPILKRLQEQKKHIDELRGQLSSFNFSSDDGDDDDDKEVKKETSSFSSAKVPPPRPRTPPSLRGTDVVVVGESPLRASSPIASKATIAQQQRTNGTRSVGLSVVTSSTDSDPVAQKSDVVTFQEPEATYLDNTERLYKSMREARIRHEGSGCGDRMATVSAANGTGGLSESASYLDAATAAATWGGDSDRGPVEDDDDDVVDGCGRPGEVPSLGSSRSSRVNRRFLNSSPCSGLNGEAGSGPIDSHSRHSNGGLGGGGGGGGVALNLPQLGHSPSPRSMDRRDLGANADLVRSLASDLARLEFKVEQLTQTCHLLVRENAHLSSTLTMLLESRRQSSLQHQHHQQQQQSRAFFQPEWMTAPAAVVVGTSHFNGAGGAVFASPNTRHREESMSGLSSVQSLTLPGGQTPNLHAHSPSLEKALDQVQMLSAQMLEHQARMNQVQADLQIALQHQQQQHQQQQQSPHFVGNGSGGASVSVRCFGPSSSSSAAAAAAAARGQLDWAVAGGLPQLKR